LLTHLHLKKWIQRSERKLPIVVSALSLGKWNSRDISRIGQGIVNQSAQLLAVMVNLVAFKTFQRCQRLAGFFCGFVARPTDLRGYFAPARPRISRLRVPS
jgi:hypothetical protein